MFETSFRFGSEGIFLCATCSLVPPAGFEDSIYMEPSSVCAKCGMTGINGYFYVKSRDAVVEEIVQMELFKWSKM